MANIWTKPFYGITHFGKLTDRRRVTVHELHDGSATLTMWVRGEGFSPEEARHPDVDSAKAAGEKWVSDSNQ